MEALISREARSRLEAGDLHAALRLYEQLSARVSEKAWRGSIERVRRQIQFQALGSRPTSRIQGLLREKLGIEQVYFVNLDRRPDRALRQYREFNRHGLQARRIPAIDAMTSREARRLLTEFRQRPIDRSKTASSHISDATLLEYKRSLNSNVFAYALSQAAVLADAHRSGYRRVLVLDDDVFFSSDAAGMIIRLAQRLPEDWRILLLGASEYADRCSEGFKSARTRDSDSFYRPLPGETCGSFAVAYDQSVYRAVLDAIEEGEGTYDNVVLGAMYRRYPGCCFAVEPAICIPDVSDSDIRHQSRDQESHSRRMNWEFSRYPQFVAPFSVTVLVSDLESLRNIEGLRHRSPSNTYIRVFFKSDDGLRPVIPGRLFKPRDTSACVIDVSGSEGLVRFADEHRVPWTDLLLVWPRDRLLDDRQILRVASECLRNANESGLEHGTVEDFIFAVNTGVRPVRGRHSVIIPSFRAPEHVWATVESALVQSASDFEVIVVNDNPANTDFRTEIDRRVQDLLKRRGASLPGALKIIQHQTNRNASAARNTGLLAASGEFVSFLDDDDRFEPQRLEAVESVLEGSPQDFGAVYCGYTGAWNGAQDSARFPEGNLGAHVLQLRYAEHYMCTNTITYRRSALDRLGGFNEAYGRHQDLELMARFFREFDIRSVSAFLVHNRPAPVPETFVADIDKLCALKHQFLRDFRTDIRARGDEFVEAVLSAHTRDIAKRDKTMAPQTAALIKTFLRTALMS